MYPFYSQNGHDLSSAHNSIPKLFVQKTNRHRNTIEKSKFTGEMSREKIITSKFNLAI